MIDEQTLQRLTRNEADMAFKKRVRTIFEWIAPSDAKVILDCGCGRGFYLNMFRTVSRCRLFGLELDPEIVVKGWSNVGHLPGITVTQASIYEQPYESGSFDGVILSEVLEHIDDDVRGLKEILRV